MMLKQKGEWDETWVRQAPEGKLSRLLPHSTTVILPFCVHDDQTLLREKTGCQETRNRVSIWANRVRLLLSNLELGMLFRRSYAT